jgi:hypothetical protein
MSDTESTKQRGWEEDLVQVSIQQVLTSLRVSSSSSSSSSLLSPNSLCFPVNCTYAVNRAFIDTVDVVVFDQSAHWEDVERTGIEIPLKRPQQFWVDLGFETSLYFPLQAKRKYNAQMDLKQR